nr:protein vip1 [Quercus suber]
MAAAFLLTAPPIIVPSYHITSTPAMLDHPPPNPTDFVSSLPPTASAARSPPSPSPPTPPPPTPPSRPPSPLRKRRPPRPPCCWITPSSVPLRSPSPAPPRSTRSPRARPPATPRTRLAKDDVAQEDKPRSRIAAEYLAHGYKLSDKAIQRALDLDKQHGISQRFTTALTQFDSKYKVSERAAATDKQYGVSQRANQGWASLSSYFEQAASTPTGQRLRNFYDQSQKQVLDVHNEARHLAGLSGPNKDMGIHQVEGTNRTKCNCGADSSSCSCAPGTCACGSCAKNPDEKTTSVSVEQAEMEKVTVDGKEKTKCNCGGAEGKCPCEPGKCSCSGCSKAS